MSLTCEVCGETYPNEHKVGCREFLLKENKRLKAICEKMAEALTAHHECDNDGQCLSFCPGCKLQELAVYAYDAEMKK